MELSPDAKFIDAHPMCAPHCGPSIIEVLFFYSSVLAGVIGLSFLAVGLIRFFMNINNKKQRKRGLIFLIIGIVLFIPFILFYLLEK